MTIEILNGPNLGNIGVREPNIYGSTSFDKYLIELRDRYPLISLGYFQSNSEGALIDKLYEFSASPSTGIVLNAGAYTHTSIALLDAIRAIPNLVVEVHISQIFQRESYRHHSLIASACCGVIAGFGLDSYRLAIEALVDKIGSNR